MNDTTRNQLRDLLQAGISGKIPYEQVRERFETVNVSKYGHSMAQWVPDFEQVHQLLLDAVSVSVPQTERLLELGAGTGRVSRLLLNHFPEAHLTAVDNSANMLTAFEQFPANLKPRVDPIEADFFEDGIGIEDNSFDAAVSVFAVCHGRTDQVYQELYQRIFDWLKPGACFVCLDHVAASTHPLSEITFLEWEALLIDHFDDETIHEIIISTIQEDFPRPVHTHLRLMETAGFTDLDVLWKKGIFAVYFGSKPTTNS